MHLCKRIHIKWITHAYSLTTNKNTWLTDSSPSDWLSCWSLICLYQVRIKLHRKSQDWCLLLRLLYRIFIQITSQELKLIITPLMLCSDINCQELLHDLWINNIKSDKWKDVKFDIVFYFIKRGKYLHIPYFIKNIINITAGK